MATLVTKLELNAEETDTLDFGIVDSTGNQISDLTGWTGVMRLAAGQSRTTTVEVACTITGGLFRAVLTPASKANLTSNGTWLMNATDTTGQVHRPHDGTFEISSHLGAVSGG